MKKLISVTMVLLLILVLLSGCGSSSKLAADNGTEQYDYYSEENTITQDGEAMPNAGSTNSTIPEGRKIVLNASLSIEALKYDETVKTILTEIDNCKGYVSDSSYYGSSDSEYPQSRSCTITARIPADKYQNFLTTAESAGNLLSKTENSEDITAQYVDVEARLASLKLEEERLLEILQAATTLDDVLTLEQRLSDVRYEIESYTTTQRTYDNLVQYSTVSISVQEVQKVTPVETGFGTRVINAIVGSFTSFVNWLQDFVVFLIYALPTLVIMGLIALVVVIIVKRNLKKSKEKQQALQQQYNEMYPGGYAPMYGAPNMQVQQPPQPTQPTQQNNTAADKGLTNQDKNQDKK